MQETRRGDTDVRRQAESTASTLADEVQRTAETQIETQKDQAASTLHTVAAAMRDSGKRMRDDQPQIASLAEQAAGKVDQASDYIRNHDVRDFVHEAEGFARREPLIFLGGAFAVGFLAARFLKASSPRQGGADGYYRGSQRQRYGAGTSYEAGRSYDGVPGRSIGESPTTERSTARTDEVRPAPSAR